MSIKSLKTPLRYPGGKSRAAQKIEAYFPDLREYDEFREPFIGGGSVAIYIAKKFPNLKIWVNDLYEPLVNFWQQLQMFGGDMHDTLYDTMVPTSIPAAILVIAKYQYQMAFVADQEINLLAALTEIMVECEFK